METVKNLAKSATTETDQFKSGHKVPIQDQSQPGRQSDMKGPDPQSKQIPTEDGGYQIYKAAGKLEGKKALITGGDSGIGRAIAILYAMEGAESLINYLPEEESDAQDTKKEVEKHGGKIHLYPADITKRENCQKLVEEAVSRMGTINILVNNAGYQNMTNSINELQEDQWIRTFDTNMHPMFYISKYTLQHLKSGDTIINCASVNAYIGRPDLLDYTSSKGAIVAFTRALSNQQLEFGIRVNCVCPGPVWTPLIPSTMKEYAIDQFTSPMGRPGQPSEIATCFVFLASQDSSFMSGQSLHPNGGVVVNG
ncbi:MAG: hypothetical protein HETSPECPRED_004822 [Heterodermia speciosa]|uniref:Oxidoreductase n=1 Tax=Heterodermia speciosa TaxID=116794 RepID=A0A8H3EL47_9LECA|nr:MAG: hypothetical protein HETSPECPRED_004822 [Heterodermia speciosa]